MAYNTVSEIRRKTGIAGNLNISSTSITSKIIISDGIVNGHLIDVYALPISGGAPAMVKELAGEVAEALILQEQYGKEVEDTDKDGYKKMETAIGLLEKIQKRELKVINDTTSLEIATTDNFRPSSYPSPTSDLLTTTASTSPVERMGDFY